MKKVDPSRKKEYYLFGYDVSIFAFSNYIYITAWTNLGLSQSNVDFLMVMVQEVCNCTLIASP